MWILVERDANSPAERSWVFRRKNSALRQMIAEIRKVRRHGYKVTGNENVGYTIQKNGTVWDLYVIRKTW